MFFVDIFHSILKLFMYIINTREMTIALHLESSGVIGEEGFAESVFGAFDAGF